MNIYLYVPTALNHTTVCDCVHRRYNKNYIISIIYYTKERVETHMY